MKSFGRPVHFSYKHKSKSLLFRNSNEDEEYLLEVDDAREQESLREYSDEVDMQKDDYIRKAKVLQDHCEMLERNLAEVQQERSLLERQIKLENAQRYEEDQEIIKAMKIMKAHIDQLEKDNVVLTEIIAKSGHQSENQSTNSADTMNTSKTKKHDNSKPVKGHGTGWSVVSNLASKLLQIQNENAALKTVTIAKREAMEELIGSTTTLRGRLEELQYENERLLTKCQSLEDVATTLTSEIDNSDSDMKKTDKENTLLDKVKKLETENEMLVTQLQALKERHIKGSDTLEASKLESVSISPNKRMKEPLHVIVETVEEDSDSDEDSDVHRSLATSERKSKSFEEKQNDDSEEVLILSKNSSNGTTICDENEVAQIDADRSSICPDTATITRKHSSPVAKEEIQKKLQESMVTRGDTDSALDKTNQQELRENNSQDMPDARMIILEGIEKDKRWRRRLLRRMKHDELTKKETQSILVANATEKGVWC